MNTPSSKSVDEIFTQFGYVCADNDYLFDYEIAELNKAKIELYQLIKDRVIGQDTESFEKYWKRYIEGELLLDEVRDMGIIEGKNDLRASQRKALSKLFGVKDDE